MKISAGLNTLVSGPFGGRRQRYESLVSSEANTSSRKVDAADGLNGVHTASSTMKLSILKLDGTSFDVTVHNNASVGELKAALETTMNELERAELGYCDIQWAQVWGHFCLCYMNQMLIDDSLMLSEIGIQLDDQLQPRRTSEVSLVITCTLLIRLRFCSFSQQDHLTEVNRSFILYDIFL